MSALKIDNRSQLIYALTEIAEIEHLLMCQYLFAAASLKTAMSELTNKTRQYHQIELIRKWKQSILTVAREEMQHLTYANNLLISVGGSPYFARPNFPCSNRFYMAGPTSPGLEMSLRPFNLETVERFIRFETNQVLEPSARMALLAAVPDPNYYATLHEFYAAMREALTPDMFIDTGSEYDPIDEGGDSIRLGRRPPIFNTVKNVDEAQHLIDMIVLEGEGSTSADPMAHVNIFRRMKTELEEELRDDPEFRPARNVASNPLTRWHEDIRPDTKMTLTIVPKDRDSGLQHGLLQLFNGAYEILLCWLFQLFGREGSQQERAAIETLAFLPYMSEVIRPLSELLTLVPVELGRSETLGASFEVTSNNFLTPSVVATGVLTVERLKELENDSTGLIEKLTGAHLDVAARELKFLQKTFCLMREEFESRVVNGWPPTPKANTDDFAYSENAGALWRQKEPPAVLDLEFQGWMQCRLATDPDSARHPRGATGNTFAVGDEPDLDRVIRFQPGGAVIRSHCPDIGVYVTTAQILPSPLHAPAFGALVPKLKGARVNLLGNPVFEGRNHLVSEDGEPIEPFDLLIEADGGIKLRRKVIGLPINDMTPSQRRGSGRFPIKLEASLAAERSNIARMENVSSPQDYVSERIKLLKDDLEKIPPTEQIGRDAESIKFRIRVLEQANWSARSVRWTRFFFGVEYLHTLSGETEATIEGLSPEFKIRKPDGDPTKDPNSKWLVNYHIGFFDSDALCAYVYGVLRIPVVVG
jgi:Ferritin-like